MGLRPPQRRRYKVLFEAMMLVSKTNPKRPVPGTLHNTCAWLQDNPMSQRVCLDHKPFEMKVNSLPGDTQYRNKLL